MGSKLKTNSDDFIATLNDVADAAVGRALQCLDDLDLREDGADHDRGARSAECLMRVASAAASLSAKLQKERLDGENADNQNAAETGPNQAAIEEEARALAEKYEQALQRVEIGDVEPPREVQPASGARVSRTVTAGLSEGGRA
ncbi:MAG: hypothetical protein AAF224_12850 [Pseudomonadota bacterium]